jgi:hypothetical protein
MASLTIPNNTNNFYPYIRTNNPKPLEIVRNTTIPSDESWIVPGGLIIRGDSILNVEGELILL